MEGWMIRSAEMAVPEFDSSSSYVRRLPPADSVVEVRTIRFVGLAFAFTSREGWRTDAVKPRVIRFAEISAFSGVQ
jgi:hypothetical protein